MKQIKNYQQREWLLEHYIHQQLSLVACAQASGHPITGAAIQHQLRKHGIPTRPVAHHLKGASNPMYGKHHSENTVRRIRQSKTGVQRSLESRVKQSESMKGEGNHRYGKERGHGQGAWVVLNGNDLIYMRSRWEVFFADWLCQQGKVWVYEPQAFTLLNGSVYTPDFLSEEVYYEVKGWYNQGDKEKIEGFHAAYPDLTLKIIDKTALKELGMRVDSNQYVPTCLALADERIRICPTCGTPFVPGRKRTRFCSYGCRKRPRTRSIEQTCKVCGGFMLVYPSQVDRKKTCSLACGRILAAQSRRARTP